ncbi:hypothetical protein J6X04_02940 [Candidatus Saccharibacteria bacterium]|nr:hypothetical protein [Candidatus Saccharibacteria bacterium]
MRVYISGISGTGMGPLALMAKQAGFEVFGSDLAKGAIYDELIKTGIEVEIGVQDGKFLQQKIEEGVDWFVYTSALPSDHAELVMAHENNLKCTKRDDFTAFLVEKLGLKMVAIAGTHGKTTTTAMIIWTALKLNLPVSYIVGTTLGFAASGSYKKGDKYFVYEADEYDRNFLKYHPWLAVIPAVSYDHPDIYPTKEDYEKAFLQFESQSEKVIQEGILENEFKLAGAVRRKDAGLAMAAILEIIQNEGSAETSSEIREILNDFPGVGRRFERLADGVYTDYAHHPEEIEATIDVAQDEAKLRNKKGVVVVYQPHQNTRQHEVRDGYKQAFMGVDKIFWLPTYLTRENPELAVIQPEEFIEDLQNKEKAEVSELNDELAKRLREYLADGYLVVLMTAGPADGWFREQFGEYKA